MIILIIILVMLAVVLAIALAVSLRSSRPDPIDQRYRDKDGNHVYYNESLIEKQKFLREHPDQNPRTFDRLFRKK